MVTLLLPRRLATATTVGLHIEPVEVGPFGESSIAIGRARDCDIAASCRTTQVP